VSSKRKNGKKRNLRDKKNVKRELRIRLEKKRIGRNVKKK
jgi:hypothetical protein